jgi:two-component SAPR family response regulator
MKHSVKQYRCVIIDDDFSSINILREYISMIPKLELVKSYLNPVSAISEIKNLGQIDFLFLDVNMPISGLEVARLLRELVKFIIVITGHPEHALKAFNAHADSFLVKPVALEKFLSAVNQVLKKAYS